MLTILTSLHKKSSRTALGVLGDISVRRRCGGFKLSDTVAILTENGAKSVLIPIGNSADVADILPIGRLMLEC